MKKIIYLFLFFVSGLYYGCASSTALLPHSTSSCLTTINGSFTSPKVYNKYSSAIIFNDTCVFRIKLGDVVSQNEDGVFFREKKYSFLHSPDTLYYPKSSIRAIVDSNYFCTYGKLNEDECGSYSLKIYIEKNESSNEKPLYFEIFSNRTFNYCIEPGKYRISKIVREISEDYFYESFPGYDLSSEIMKNKQNIIGDLTLLVKENINENTIKIPFYKQVKSNNVGAAFGFIGALIADISNESSKNEVAGYFYFEISNSKCPLVFKRKF